MKIIDAHMHFSKIASFSDTGLLVSGVDYSDSGYRAEAGACGIVRSVCMGLTESPPAVFPDAGAPTPMLADLSDEPPREIAVCLGVNPHTLTGGALETMEALIQNGRGPGGSEVGPVVGSGVSMGVRQDVGDRGGREPCRGPGGSGVGSGVCTGEPGVGVKIAGIKIYAGYYHFDVNDPVYAPVYDIAEKYDLAVAIHSGDTYSEKGKLVYSQPLSVDNLAVDRPGMRIVICHMGAPWIYDCCEVAGKNPNVYMDLSGMHVGDAAYFSKRMCDPLLINYYKQALTVMDKYDKVLFGTDWPLAPMASYIEFCKELVPPDAYAGVFYENAARVYKLEKLEKLEKWTGP